MSEKIHRDDVNFTIDGEAVSASPYETVLQTAKRFTSKVLAPPKR